MENPRMGTRCSDLERTLELMSLCEELIVKEKVRKTIRMLGSCFPSGTKRDTLGITYQQMLYIISLARFDEDEALQFCRIARMAGGLDSHQAHYLIGRFKEEKQGERRRPA